MGSIATPRRQTSDRPRETRGKRSPEEHVFQWRHQNPRARSSPIRSPPHLRSAKSRALRTSSPAPLGYKTDDTCRGAATHADHPLIRVSASAARHATPAGRLQIDRSKSLAPAYVPASLARGVRTTGHHVFQAGGDSAPLGTLLHDASRNQCEFFLWFAGWMVLHRALVFRWLKAAITGRELGWSPLTRPCFSRARWVGAPGGFSHQDSDSPGVPSRN